MKDRPAFLAILVTSLALLGPASTNMHAAILPVTNTNDSGSGSLRQALASAADGDTIDATGAAGAITLITGQLDVSNSVVILGPGPGGLTVSGNQAFRVFNITGSNVTISGLTIAKGNAPAPANPGGGIYSGGSVLTVSNCTISGNSGGLGGGIFNTNAMLAISACTFSGNSGVFGGGICNEATGQFVFPVGGGSPPIFNAYTTINACTFSSNTATFYGGGIYNYDNGGNTILSIIASTFSANSSLTSGGAIANVGPQIVSGLTSGYALLLINASTFSGNSAPDAGIVNSYAWLEIGDTILNAGGSNSSVLDAGSALSDGYNLASDDGGGLLTSTGDQINTNPKLGPLQNNGGPTMTHALLHGSPAIDQGKLNAFTNYFANLLGLTNFSVTNLVSYVDQRGFPRPVDNPSISNAPGGDSSDIGAYEEQFSALSLQITNAASRPGQMNLIYAPWAVGWTYNLQCTTNPVTTPFAPLTGCGSPVTNGDTATVTDLAPTAPQKYYRLQISHP